MNKPTNRKNRTVQEDWEKRFDDNIGAGEYEDSQASTNWKAVKAFIREELDRVREETAREIADKANECSMTYSYPAWVVKWRNWLVSKYLSKDK